MAKRRTGSTCCLTLPLKLEKWQEDRLSKRFEIARKIYNTMVNAELKKLRRLEQSAEYRQNQAVLSECYQNMQTKTKEYNAAAAKRNELLRQAGFTKYSFKSDIKDYYKYFNDNIGSSIAMHCIAAQVWDAFDKYLFGKGKKVHFKKTGDIRSLKGYSYPDKSGGKEIIYRGDHIEWKGIYLPLKLDPDNVYETEMLTRRVKYVRLIRQKGKTRDHWYAQLTLEGTPVIKINPETGATLHPIGSGAVGIDIGPQTVAIAAKNEAVLLELADKVQNIEHEKRLLQRKLDRSRRATNPENYAEDGTIKRGVKLTHNKSKRYRRVQKELAYLQHRQAEIRKQQHNELANHLLSLGDCFYVEDMEWPALTRRAKETAISEKTGKYKRKKRFGKSVANKAPAMLVQMLQTKCETLGLPGVVRVPTTVKASQYNHITKDYQKKSLSQRWNYMSDGRRIQRDLYSAFLLQHINPEYLVSGSNSDVKAYLQEDLEKDYENFVNEHDRAIQTLSEKTKTISSMGITRNAS